MALSQMIRALRRGTHPCDRARLRRSALHSGDSVVCSSITISILCVKASAIASASFLLALCGLLRGTEHQRCNARLRVSETGAGAIGSGVMGSIVSWRYAVGVLRLSRA